MHYCFLYVASMVTFTQLLRYAQRRGAGVLSVSAANYVAAAVLSAGALAWVGAGEQGRWIATALGGANGTLYFLHLLVILAAYRLVGVGITLAFVSLGIVVPVIVSWALWDETMTWPRWIAVALLPVAVVLLRPRNSGHRRLTFKGDVVLLLAFAMPGLIGTIHKASRVYAPQGQTAMYQAALFAAAAVVSVIYVARRRLGYDRTTVMLGIVVGGVNVLATLFILLSLAALPAVVFYPTSASLVIGSSVLVSWLLWREKVTGRQVVGLAIAAGVVALASL